MEGKERNTNAISTYTSVVVLFRSGSDNSVRSSVQVSIRKDKGGECMSSSEPVCAAANVSCVPKKDPH